MKRIDQLVCSPACLPVMPLRPLLATYAELGFSKIEGFSEWAEAHLDWRANPDQTREKLEEFIR